MNQVRCLRSSGAGLSIALFLMGAAQVARAEERSPGARPDRKVDDYAISTGLRAGLFLPSGGLYADRDLITTPFRDVASPGPSVELDFGTRFVRYFVVYALFEQAFLGRGDSAAWTSPHGGQTSPSTQALGMGLRWESNPDGWGLIADVAFAHRWFTARWTDSTAVHMRGPGEVRLGIGLNWRVTRQLALAPMATLLTGTFTHRTLDGQTLGELNSSYAAASLALSAQADF